MKKTSNCDKRIELIQFNRARKNIQSISVESPRSNKKVYKNRFELPKCVAQHITISSRLSMLSDQKKIEEKNK